MADKVLAHHLLTCLCSAFSMLPHLMKLLQSATMEKHTVSSPSALSEDDEHVPFLNLDAEEGIVEPIKIYWYLRNTAACILCAISVGFIIISLRYPTDDQCTRKMSTWSPMLEAVGYEWRHFQTTKPGSYYGKPTVQLEREWDGLWQCK
jgi:hypothetical protein